MLNGSTVDINAWNKDTLLVLKDSIASQTGCAVSKQRLIFAGKMLPESADVSTLEELGLQDQCSLHVVVKAIPQALAVMVFMGNGQPDGGSPYPYHLQSNVNGELVYKARDYADKIFRRGESWCYSDSTQGQGDDAIFCRAPFSGGLVPPTGWLGEIVPYTDCDAPLSIEVRYEQADGSWEAKLP